jgi:hypothetical protein
LAPPLPVAFVKIVPMPSALVHISHARIMAVQETTFCIGILLNTLQAPTFCIHVNEAAAHKGIILATILVDQLFYVPAWFKCCYTTTGIQDSTKVIGSGFTSSYSICQKSSNANCPSPHFTCPRIVAMHGDHMTCGHLAEHSLSIVNTPTFGIHVNKTATHEDISFKAALYDLSMDASALFNCM